MSIMSQDRFNNPKYIDWVKVKLTLQYAKEGLEPITEQKVQAFHNNLCSKLQAPSSSSATGGPTICNSCVKDDQKKQWSKQNFSCSNGICDGWLDLLQKEHVHMIAQSTPRVEWDNVDVSQLPTNRWECVKLFLPRGSKTIQRAGDADLAAILTLFLNCRHFASSMNDVNLCKRVKEVRNGLLHSGTMEVDAVQMQSNIGLIKQLLQDPAFAANTSCQEAITKIDQLVRDKLELSQNKELELAVLNGDIKSVTDKTDHLRTEVSSLKDILDTEVTSLNDKLDTEVTSLNDKLDTEVTSLNDKLDTEVTSLNDKLDTEVTSLNDKLDTEVTSLNDKLDTEVTSLNDKLDTEVTSLNDKVDTEVTGIKDKIDAEVSGLNQKLDTEVSGLNKKLDTEVSDLNKKLDTEVSGLNKKLDTEIGGVNAEMTSLKNKLDVSLKDIVELQTLADILCRFINACKIDKVDIGQLAASISTLSALRAETDRQGQILAQLQETVGRHEVTLEQHGGTLEQHRGTLEQHGGTLEQHERKLNILEAKRGRSDRQNSEAVDIAALQLYLVALYKDECQWKNPMPVETDEAIPISQMYARPSMKMIRQKGENINSAEEQQRRRDATPVPLDYMKIFTTKTENCRNIYVTGNAGMGKTTFCQKLVFSWCKAVSEEGDSDEDLNVLKQFRLLFHVNLREVASLYDIEHMIKKNLLRKAPYNEYDVSGILETEKCLVVLDGLDEWPMPQNDQIYRGLNKYIPGRNTMNKTCVYVTTTRNWKFCVADLEWSKDYDKQVELCGIDNKTCEDFARRVVGQLNSKLASAISRPVSGFFLEVEQKKLDSLTTVPVLLIQLLTLWFFCKDLGKSQVQLYCRMLDTLLEQAKKHLSEKSSTVTKPVQTDAELPGCFTEEEDNCRNHTQLLLCLSKLAFMSLLNKKKEDSLVFKSSRLEVCGIDSSDISLCLKCGIFTQTNFVGNPIGRYKKYSFIHKKLQEFLAAVYLVTSHDVEKNLRQVREYCDKLDTTLEMGQMYMFVCGMNAEVGNKLLEHLTSVVEGDNSVQNSRQSLVGEILINNIHTSVMACVTEGASNGLTIDAHLQDFYIGVFTISDYIEHVVEKQNTSIKSVYINTYNCSEEHVTVVLKHLQKVQTLEKLWLSDPLDVVSDSSMLAPVLTTNVSTLQSLCLTSGTLARDKALFTAVLGCVPSLRALWLGRGGLLRGMVVSHGQREQLLAATSHLTHLGLYLDCTDHGRQCRPVLDLSHHTQLQTLRLWSMCVTNLHAVAHSVEKVMLECVTVAHSSLRQFIEALAQSSNKVEVVLRGVTVTEHSGEAADTLAYIRDCDKFTVIECDNWLDETWCVKFHKK